MAHLINRIYNDAARSVVWGDGNSGTLVVTDSFALPAPSVTKYYPVYGWIFGRQNVAPSVCNDRIVVSLDF